MEVREVLVTGGTGRFGRQVVELMRAEGLEKRRVRGGSSYEHC